MYARLFYLLHIIFNFLKGYIMSKTTNKLIIDFLDFKISMLKAETSVCEEMRAELIRNDENESMASPKQENIFKGDIQPEINQTPMTTVSEKVIEPVSTACSLPHFVS